MALCPPVAYPGCRSEASRRTSTERQVTITIVGSRRPSRAVSLPGGSQLVLQCSKDWSSGNASPPVPALEETLSSSAQGWVVSSPCPDFEKTCCVGVRNIFAYGCDMPRHTPSWSQCGLRLIRWCFSRLHSQCSFWLLSVYSLNDMANDVVGLMDALQLRSAHIMGSSMGGMIAQCLAIDNPTRVRSLCCTFSSTGEPHLPRASLRVLLQVLCLVPFGTLWEHTLRKQCQGCVF